MNEATASRLRARFPLTTRYLGEAFVVSYLARHADTPFAEHVRATHAGGLIVDRAARDLARYEEERARLASLPALREPKEPLPDDKTRLVLSPDVALLMYGADLVGMVAALRAGGKAVPRPKRAWVLLTPAGGGEVRENHLTRDDEGWLLEWFREPTTVADLLPMTEERAPFEAVWKKGLLHRA